MRSAKYVGIVAALCLISVSLFAQKTKDSTKINLNEAVQVGTSRLAPGDYKVEWTGSGDNLHVSFMQGKKVVATAEGKMVDLSYTASDNAIVTKAMNSGVVLDQIQFSNKKQALAITPSEVAQN